MVEVSNKFSEERQRIKNDREKFALQTLAEAENLEEGWELAFNDESKDWKVWVANHDDGPKVVTKYRGDGVTM